MSLSGTDSRQIKKDKQKEKKSNIANGHVQKVIKLKSSTIRNQLPNNQLILVKKSNAWENPNTRIRENVGNKIREET